MSRAATMARCSSTCPASTGAIVRLSRGVGLPKPLPDVLGLAVRIVDAHGPNRHQDLLLVTSVDAPVLHHLILPGPLGSYGQSYSSVLPYRLGDRLALVGALPRRPDFELADGAGRRSPHAPSAACASASAPRTRRRRRCASTSGTRAAGSDPTGPFQGIRAPAYRGSQSGRGRSVSDRAARLAAIAADIDAHLPCGELEICDEATNLVPGEGDADADVVFVGEAPGAAEDEQGRPFVGTSGRLLDALLAEAGLAREQVFITNVVKARPPKNRDPKPAEVRHYLPWLIAQLAGHRAEARRAARPPSARPLRARGEDLRGPRDRARDAERRLFPLYHPAAALHNPKLRETLVEDARALRALLASIV